MTLYYVRFKILATGKVIDQHFDSMLARELMIITLGGSVAVLDEWEAYDTPKMDEVRDHIRRNSDANDPV